MAHNIYNDGTKDCMFVVGNRDAAWHRLGQRTPNAVNWEQAMKLAGLDWKVLKQQNYARQPIAPYTPVPVQGWTVFRSSDNAELGQVGPDYVVKQNEDCFKFVDTLLEANGGAHYDSAGALGNGARIWCAVRVPKADINVLGEDKQETYLVFTTSHDGSMSHTVKLTCVRVVCQNTLQASLNDAGAMLRVKHTRNADARLADASRLMTGVVQDAKQLETKLNTLARRRMTRESMVTVLNRLFPQAADAAVNQTRRSNMLADVLSLYESNDRDAIPAIRGTAYNLLNAITEYTDHIRTARITDAKPDGYTLAQARAESAVSGSGDKLKTQALAVIDECTESSPDASFNVAGTYAGGITDAEFARQLGIKL